MEIVNKIMMKKLLILNDVAPEDGIGGQATFLRNIMPYLAQQYQLRLLTLPKPFLKIKWIPRRLMYLSYILSRLFTLRSTDIIFSNTPESAFIASHVNGNRLFHIFHGNTNPVTTSKFWYGRYFKWVFDWFDKSIIRRSRQCYTVGEARPKTSFLYQPIDTAFLESVQPNTVDKRNFIFVGRLEEVKQVNKILLGFKEYLNSHTTSDKLLIFGTGILEDKYKEMARQEGLVNHVEFKGETAYAEVIAHMKSSKILLMASLYEGFPMVIAEALSCGIPVIATEVGSISKVVKNEINGILLPVDFSKETFSKAIEEISAHLPLYSEEALKSARVFNAELLVRETLLKDFESPNL